MLMGMGFILPMLFLLDMALTEFAPVLAFLIAVLVLAGVWTFQHLWVKAGQVPPLS